MQKKRKDMNGEGAEVSNKVGKGETGHEENLVMGLGQERK
jgi:hypothetical protein